MDILGLDPNVAVHKLNLDRNAKKIAQKKREFVLKIQKAIAKEVEKLKIVGFILGVQFPTWLPIWY